MSPSTSPTLGAELAMFGRFATALGPFLRATWTAESAEDAVRDRLSRREENLLATLATALADPGGVYARLFAAAGVERGDCEAMVRRDGAEAALEALRSAGVWVGFEEFKGRMPIVRGGAEIVVAAADFDNPRRRIAYVARSGGSTGVPTRVGTDLDHLAAQAASDLLAHRAHGSLGAPTAVWLDAFPDGSGVNTCLRLASMGQMPRRWLTHTFTDRGLAWRYRLGNRALVAAARFAGRPLPRLEPLALGEAHRLATWAAETVRAEGQVVVCSHVSKLLRIALAAGERGLDLSGAVFWGGGEPPSRAKVARIEASGARWFPGYWLREAGVVGQGCVRPRGPNDIHLNLDALAVIQHRRTLPEFGHEVTPFLFTSLLPAAPKLMINVEVDDLGVLERRACGCPLGALGLDVHLRDVRSFRKLTGEGVTLLAGELARLLDEELPRRCGGTPLDYQLVERENASGFTELVVVVAPEVPLADEATAVQAVRAALAGGSAATRIAGGHLGAAGAITVRRERPRLSPAGKHVPFIAAGVGGDGPGAGVLS